MADTYMQPNALANSFRGGQPGAGLKAHFLTKQGEQKAMVRIAGNSFFLDVSELNRLVLTIEHHIDFINTHVVLEPPCDFAPVEGFDVVAPGDDLAPF